MNKEQISEMKEEVFRRATGVSKASYGKMKAVLEAAEEVKKASGGRPSKLTIDEKLLMTLEYWREYRTYFHMSHSWGISESSVCKTIRWCEDTLIRSGQFSLPGKKQLRQTEANYDLVLVDVTETPIQRPKKSKNIRLISCSAELERGWW